MPSDRPSLELFLSPAGDARQSLTRGLPPGALARAPGAEATTSTDSAHPTSFLDPGGDPNSLRDQGWGVIAPRGEAGDRLLALARPLLDKRAADQDAEVPVYRVAPDMTAAASAAWIDRKLVDNALYDAIPGYLLVLGGPTQISFELQQVLATGFGVGRVGFDAEASYEAYIDKLLRSERGPPPGPPRVVYFTARDGTPATDIGHRLLMQPCITDAEHQRAAGRFAASEIATIEDDDPARAADRLLAAAPGPDVVFSCSHGAGAPRDGWGSPDRRRALQGALCLGRGQRLEAEALARTPFAPGGAWLMFACFGAGTPRSSAFHPWLARLQQHGEHAEDLSSVLVSLPAEGEPPFIAALPQAALANPDGPLAIIGHLDLAWSYGFCDLDKMSRGERHRRFHELIAQLVKGSRVGLALGGSLMRARTQVQNELAISAADAARAGHELLDQQVWLGHRWMVQQDLDGYIALGDPAARVTTGRPDARAHDDAAAIEPAAVADLRSGHPGAIGDAAAPAARLAGPAIDAGVIAAAVHELIAGRATLAELAGRHGVAPAAIAEWHRVYTEAGLRAVSELAASAGGPARSQHPEDKGHQGHKPHGDPGDPVA
jgi:hypothetical protein